MIKQNIKVYELAKELSCDPSNFYGWFRNNRVPKSRLKILAQKLNTSEEYLNTIVNDTNTYKPKGIRELNKYEIRGDTTALFMQKRNGELFETLIDTEDLEKVLRTNLIWHVIWDIYTKSYYAKASAYKQKPSTVSLHRVVMDVTDPLSEVDHENHDTLDNRKYNLRVTNNINNLKNRGAKNTNNKSGYRNVYWNTNDARWVVSLQIEGKRREFGRFKFKDLDKAGERAEAMRQLHYKEYAGNN